MIDIHQLSGRLGNEIFRDAYIYSQFRDGIIPDIYLQSEKYFEKYKDEIKKRYSYGISRLPYVALHVRRGDYVDNPFYVDLFEDGYYERAMAEFPDQKFIVFSDDIGWCFDQPTFKGTMFNALPEVVALNEMASCIGHIIANSSFSWWGAYLSPHGGKVVAPKKWFTDGVERVGLPDSWIRV